MGGEDVRIERLTSISQLHECESLQERVWELTATDIVPLHLLVTFQRCGGLVLGAFDATGRLVGFLAGFLGATEGDVRRPKHCSHMMGVLEEWRGRGVGHRLKLAQREHALAQGLDLVTWTYDPLESQNAALNIGKLGGVSCTYIRDLYGPMTDGLNAGLATDRFQVDWWIASARVARRLAQGELAGPALVDLEGATLNPARIRSDGLLEPTESPRDPEVERVAVEIPLQIRALKRSDMALAARWRAQTRGLFEGCFAAGYTVTGLVNVPQGGLRRSFYILEKGGEASG